MLMQPLESRTLLTSVPLPSIPTRSFNVINYGAIADGTTDNTAAIQATINAASAAGGGTVRIPAGGYSYLSGPLNLKNYINLQLDAGATLKMRPYPSYPLAPGASDYASLVNVQGLHDVAITGSGTIDGDGDTWWGPYDAGTVTAGRPAMLLLESSSNLLVSGVTLIDAPNVHISVHYINTNVTIDGITINTPYGTPNTDGIDATGKNVVIKNSYISCGDDNIAFGGRGSQNIYVENCSFGTGHGLSIGSYTGGGLDGLTVTNCYFEGTSNGIRSKSARGRGGLVQNLSYTNLVMRNVSNPINMLSYYPKLPANVTSDPAQAITADTPYWKNVTIASLDASGASVPVNLCGLPEAPLQNFTLRGVTIAAASSGFIYNATGMSLLNTTLSPSYATHNAAIATTGGGPTIASAAQASPAIPSGKSTSLSVLGADAGGESALTYTWTAVGRLPAAVTFSSNGTNSAKSTTVTFSKPGEYPLQVVVTDATGLTRTSSVIIDVPEFTNYANSGTASASQQYTSSTAANAFDGLTSTRWVSDTSGSTAWLKYEFAAGVSRTITRYALTSAADLPSRDPKAWQFQASNDGENWTTLDTRTSESFSSRSLSRTFEFTNVNSYRQYRLVVNDTAVPGNGVQLAELALLSPTLGTSSPTLLTPITASASNMTGANTQLSVSAADDLGEASLNYGWSTITKPQGAADPIFSISGTNAAKNTTATLSLSGRYVFQVVVTDSDNLSISNTLTFVHLVGDADRNGIVSTMDFNILASSFGASGKTWKDSDFSGDGIVDSTDFVLLTANFGANASQFVPASAASLALSGPNPRLFGTGRVEDRVLAELL
jgi:polygalacturonase